MKIPLRGLASYLLLMGVISYAMEPKVDLYVRINYDTVFDQAQILQKPEFRTILVSEGVLKGDTRLVSSRDAQKSSDDLNKALVDDFMNKKIQAMRESAKKPLVVGGANMAVAAAAALAGGAVNPMAGGFGAMGAVHTVGENLKSIGNAAYEYYYPENDPLHKHEERYAQIKRFYSESLQQKIQDRFAAARKSPESVDSVLTFLQTALNVPVRQSIPRAFRGKTMGEIGTMIDNALKDCDPHAQSTLKAAMWNHITRQSSSTGTLSSPKIIPYLLGDPGTGKTYHAKRIAEFFKLPLLEVKITSNDASSLVGDEHNPGAFLKAITTENTYNDAVILIDDIDRILNANEDSSLNSMFLTFIEPSTQTFSSPYLGGGKIDTSRYFFVLCGNNDLKCDALKTRLEVIKFSLNAERKKAIVKSKLSDLCFNKIPALNLVVSELAEEQQDEINQLIEDDALNTGFRDLESKLIRLLNKFRQEKAPKDVPLYPAPVSKLLSSTEDNPFVSMNNTTVVCELEAPKKPKFLAEIKYTAMCMGWLLGLKSCSHEKIEKFKLKHNIPEYVYLDENDGVIKFCEYTGDQGGRTDYDY